MIILFAIVMTSWLLGVSFLLIGEVLNASLLKGIAKVTLISALP